MSTKNSNTSQELFNLNGKPSFGQALPLAFQHVVAMIIGCVAPAIILAGVSGLSESDTVVLIQASLAMSAISTFIQLFPFIKFKSYQIGAGLPVIMGISFAYVPSMQAIASDFDIATILGAQIIGAGVIVHVFTGLPEWVGGVGMGIIVILYCMTGGMKGAMMTDVIQGSLMIATAVVTFIVSIVMGGGFSNINHTLQSMNEAYLTFPGANGYMPRTYYISNIVLWSFITMGQPHLFTKFFAMKDHKTMFKAILLGTAGMVFSATLIEWAGVNGIASIQNIEKADQIIPMILQRGMNPFLASIFIAGIVAAGMSTIDGIQVTTTGAVTRDIYQTIINKNATDEAVMSLSKVVTVIIGIVVICFGVFQPGSIFEINLFAFSGMAIFVVPILFGIYWKKATAKGAIASVIVGIISLLLFTLNPSVKALAMGFHALFPTTIIASIVMIVVSKFTETPPQETIDRHFTV